jgi:predicted GNAT family N-acyltransferase
MNEPESVEILTDPQIEQLHELYQGEWWSKGRSLEDTRDAVRNSSLVFGFVEPLTGRLIGFCRVLTDFTFRATVYDVIVAPEFRGQGLGQRIMKSVLAHPRLQRVGSITLACTKLMTRFYERFGFSTMPDDVVWMRRPCDAA